jgi:hypothetical protein
LNGCRRSRTAEICRKTGNRRAVQVLLSHTKVLCTVRHLEVELKDALYIALFVHHEYFLHPKIDDLQEMSRVSVHIDIGPTLHV